MRAGIVVIPSAVHEPFFPLSTDPLLLAFCVLGYSTLTNSTSKNRVRHWPLHPTGPYPSAPCSDEQLRPDRPHVGQRAAAAAGDAVGPGGGRRGRGSRRGRRRCDLPGHPPVAGAGAAAAALLGRGEPALAVLLLRRAVHVQHGPRVHRHGGRGGRAGRPLSRPRRLRRREQRPAAGADRGARARAGGEPAGHRGGHRPPAAAGAVVVLVRGAGGGGGGGGAAGEEGRGGGQGGGMAGRGGGQDQQQVQAGGGGHQRVGEPADPHGHHLPQQDREEAGGGACQGDGEGAERGGAGAAEGGGEAGVGGGGARDKDGQGHGARQLHEGRRQGAHQALLLLLLLLRATAWSSSSPTINLLSSLIDFDL